MRLEVLGLNHKTAPVEMREQLAVSEGEVSSALADLMGFAEIKECLILSTCNRTELYVVSSKQVPSRYTSLMSFLKERTGLRVAALEPYCYYYEQAEAVAHLFRVASGLDSMVLGENQILSQLKQSYQFALDQNSAGAILNRVIPWALKVGKLSRSQTAINQGAASISSAAIELGKALVGDFKDKNVLLVGAGHMIQLAMHSLVAKGEENKNITITNRTYAKALELAEQNGLQTVPFEGWKQEVRRWDLILTCTASDRPILSFQDGLDMIRLRKGRPLFIIDMALPRDVDSRCHSIENFYLYNLDDIQANIDNTMSKRSEEAKRVEDLVAHHTRQVLAYLEGQKAAKPIQSFRGYYDNIREAEVERFLKKGFFAESQREQLEHFSRALMNKFLHQPTVEIRNLARAGATEEELHSYLSSVMPATSIEEGEEE